MMGLDDLASYGEAQPEPDVASCEEWGGALLGSFEGETGAVILNFDLQILPAISCGFGVKTHANLGIGRIRLEGIEHDFGKRVFKRCTVAGKDNRCAAGVVFELGGLDRLVLAGFLVGFFDERAKGKGVLGDDRIASQKPHLIDEPSDSLDALREGGIKGGAEFRVLPFI